MQFRELQNRLQVLDKTLLQIERQESDELNRRLAAISINIKKMEFLNLYIVEVCPDGNLLQAVEQFSALALKAVKELLGYYEREMGSGIRET
jgi:ribose 1,5-bisphosphokinase PhnN